MVSYVTNRDKRCIYCEGREVITLSEGNIPLDTSLMWSPRLNSWVCKDRDECRRNVEAENTTISFMGDEKGIKKIVATKDGKIVSEVESTDGNPLKGWFG